MMFEHTTITNINLSTSAANFREAIESARRALASEKVEPQRRIIPFNGKLYSVAIPQFADLRMTPIVWCEPQPVFQQRPIHSRGKLSPCAKRRRSTVYKKRQDRANRRHKIMKDMIARVETRFLTAQPRGLFAASAY